jgi:hypothetical protein
MRSIVAVVVCMGTVVLMIMAMRMLMLMGMLMAVHMRMLVNFPVVAVLMDMLMGVLVVCSWVWL